MMQAEDVFYWACHYQTLSVRLSFKSSSNKDTLAKYQSNLMLRFDLFKSSTSFLTTWTPRFNGGALPSLPRYGMAL